jgi:nickel-dependent lactate racemase
MRINYNYAGIPSFEVNESNLVGVFEPNEYKIEKAEEEIMQEGLCNPIGAPKIREMVSSGKRILIITDDYTRTTPTDKILPFVLEELNKGGIVPLDISLLIAQGTHRKMKAEEKKKKLGQAVVNKYTVLDHEWNNNDVLDYLGDSSSGIPIWINKQIKNHDFVIGIGHIVPHFEAGFSGGAKIIQPGVCGRLTTEGTHWLAASYKASELLGQISNPVRKEIEEIAKKVNNFYVINVVQNRGGRIVGLFCGDPIKAHRQGSHLSKKIYGVHIPCLSDIVIIDSYPSDNDLWVAAKGIFAADLAVKKGGIIILVTPCPEGIASEHPQITDYKFLPYQKLKELVGQKKLKNDLIGAAYLAYIGNIIKEKAKCIIVSPGIDSKIIQNMGLMPAETPTDALKKAFDIQGKDASVTVFKHGSEVLPIVKP